MKFFMGRKMCISLERSDPPLEDFRVAPWVFRVGAVGLITGGNAPENGLGVCEKHSGLTWARVSLGLGT